jgi:methylmalonyl-CoA mutase N-terminal domain/subunit
VAERRQGARTVALRARRDSGAVEGALADVGRVAEGSDNLLVPIRAALAAEATVGEVCEVLRRQWGTYDAARSRP